MVQAYHLEDFPPEEFGEGIKRQVRLIMSPYTTGYDKASIVYTVVAPLGTAEGHVHEESDEIIYFTNAGGIFVLDGEECVVKKNSVVLAPMGSLHECRNTNRTESLRLFCVFVPALKPYGKYPEIIKKTKLFLQRKSEGEHHGV